MIDWNNNGKIDPDENFYGCQTLLARAIADGEYPSLPGRIL